MNLLGFDFETTGVDPKTCRPIEFGCQVYNGKTKEREKPFSTFIWEESYPPLTKEIEDLTGITTAEARQGVDVEIFLMMVDPLIQKADILVAYNAPYDKKILERCYLHAGMEMPAKPFLCMFSDMPYPQRYMRCKQLSHRAFDHGIPMDGRKIHRALGDVELMWDILDRYDLTEVLEYWKTPWVYLSVTIPGPWTDGGKGRDWAKGQGFGWEEVMGDGTRRFTKTWVKRVKQNQLQEYLDSVKDGPYPVDVLK